MVVRAATRGSALARWQTDHVAALLRAVHGERIVVEAVVVQTEGDRRQDVPLEQIGGRGVFVKEVQAAVLDGRADFAVHSAKDLPSSADLQPDGLTIAAVPARGDARDAIVGSALADLEPGALVATGSTRRRAQLASLRPDLTFVGLRGNIDTRLARLLSGDGAADGTRPSAVVVAAAALERLGRFDTLSADGVAYELLEPTTMLPQVAQGALAIECRVDDGDTRALLADLDEASTRSCVDAERGFLATLGGGCDLPVGAHALLRGDRLALTALLATHDGSQVIRAERTGPAREPVALGEALAAHLLDERGGRNFLTV